MNRLVHILGMRRRVVAGSVVIMLAITLLFWQRAESKADSPVDANSVEPPSTCSLANDTGDGVVRVQSGVACLPSDLSDAALADLPPAPVLIAPANAVTITSLIPTFQIDSGQEGVLRTAQFEFGPDGGFSTGYTTAWGCGTTSRYQEWRDWDNLPRNRTVFWRARITYGNHCVSDAAWGPWSPTWHFTTPANGVTLPGPVLIAPANNSVISGLPLPVSWQPTGASHRMDNALGVRFDNLRHCLGQHLHNISDHARDDRWSGL